MCFFAYRCLAAALVFLFSWLFPQKNVLHSWDYNKLHAAFMLQTSMFQKMIFSLFGFCSLPFLRSFKLCWNSPCKLWHIYVPMVELRVKSGFINIGIWSHCRLFGTSYLKSNYNFRRRLISQKSSIIFINYVFVSSIAKGGSWTSRLCASVWSWVPSWSISQNRFQPYVHVLNLLSREGRCLTLERHCILFNNYMSSVLALLSMFDKHRYPINFSVDLSSPVSVTMRLQTV